jgi:hypothetical protein
MGRRGRPTGRESERSPALLMADHPTVVIAISQPRPLFMGGER